MSAPDLIEMQLTRWIGPLWGMTAGQSRSHGGAGWTSVGMLVYQAMLSNPDNLARIQSAKREIERVKGRVRIAAPTKGGLTLVVLELPEGYTPDQFVPGLPFYPV